MNCNLANAYQYVSQEINGIGKETATYLFETLDLDIQEATLLDLYAALDGKDPTEIATKTVRWSEKKVEFLIECLNTSYANKLADEGTKSHPKTGKNRIMK